jgi:hypothetical protein
MTIESYGFGEMAIDGQTYDRDLIIMPDRVWDSWWREEGHRLSVADLKEVFEAEPEVLIVGTGFYDRMHVPVETSREVEKRGIELHVLSTGKAWALYNQLESTDRRVVAAFHLTC